MAQVSGRNSLSWDDKLAKDIEYVKAMSFTTDLNIFFKTAKKVLLPDTSNIEMDPDMLGLDEYRKLNPVNK